MTVVASCALAMSLGGARTTNAAGSRRIGIVLDSRSEEAIDAASAFRDAPWPDPSATVFIERRVTGDETDARAALAELALDGADALVVFADFAEAAAGPTVRGRVVIGAAPTAASSTRDTCLRLRGGILASELPEMLTRLVGNIRRIGYVVPAGVVGPGIASGPFIAVSLEGDTPAKRATNARTQLIPRCDVIVVAPDVSADDVAALATEMGGSGVPLVGTRRLHLEAGAAVVLRTAPRDLGTLAAALCFMETDGLTPNPAQGAPPRAPARIVREVNLSHARRLSFAVPVPFLATADYIVPLPRPRR